MSRQTRTASRAQNSYSHQIPVSLAPSSLYNQHRLSMPSTTTNYFEMTAAPASSPSMQLAPHPPYQGSRHQQPQLEHHNHRHHHQQQQQQLPSTFDASYVPSITAPPIPLPTSHRPSSGAWTPSDDQQLMQARAQGLNWNQIKDQYFPNKTANACRKRHERLAEKRDADDWDARKFQRLAKEYMAMRKEIWAPLAARTGEKWNVVEQKCMANGLKNLQSASRAASRHDSLQRQSAASGAQLSGYDDDSGISGIALTPVDEIDASYSSPEENSSANSAVSGTGPYASLSSQSQQNLGGHSYIPYGVGSGGYAPHHRYSSSVSSSASAGHYSTGAGSSSGSPYLSDQRLPNPSDMGIGAIINRPRGELLQ